MNRLMVLFLVAIMATAAALAQCGGDETPAESLGTCSTCDALQVEPQQGKVPCNGACEETPAPGDTYKCVESVDGVGGECVLVNEGANLCAGGVDDDADGLTDCDDPDCAGNLLCVPVPCEPVCAVGNKCGSDGCGGKCGACEAWETCMNDGSCFCAPKCGGKNCGDNGCGGKCGTCPAGMECNLAGLCEVTCTPDCDTEVCGDDGCDGECGPGCADDEVCTAVGDCILAACPKQCGDNECGPDGCGSFCGVCPLGEECNAAGVCEAVPCEPVCAVGNKCGSDGCGGKCGVCAVGETCLANGTCICVKQCGGKNCGDDGCGDNCGTCPAGMMCEVGLCKASPCVPNCGVKVCGNDGCGGDCGKCPAGKECTDVGTCIPTGPVPPAEVCDNGQDDDGDGKMDAADPDCDGKTVAVLGIYVAYPAFMKTETADGQSWEGDLPGDWTVTVSVLGGEVPTKIWVNTKAVSSATSPQGFVVWDGSTGVAPPAWPVDGGLPVAPGKSFSASFNEATWFNIQLSGF